MKIFKKKSIIENYFYNTLFIIGNMIFPLITLPYLSRILGPEGLGKINFAFSYTAFLTQFAMLGIPIYGLRAISINRDDQIKLNKTFSELLIINSIFSFILFIFFIVTIFLIPKFYNDFYFFLPFSLTIIFSVFSLEWFYGGMENYKFNSLRNLSIKTLILIAILNFIKQSGDYYYYSLIIASGALTGALINIYGLSGKVQITLKSLNLKKYFPTVFILAGIQIANGIFLYIDKVMIGFLLNNSSVGYYSIPARIAIMTTALITSLSSILIPRISYLVSKNLNKEINNLCKKSIEFILMLAFPAISGLIILSEDLIIIISGNEFYPSIFTMKIISFTILISSIITFFSMQILFPFKKEKIILISIFTGGFINFLLNLIFLPKFGYNGAAYATIISSLFVLVIQFLYSSKLVLLSIFSKNIITYFFGSVFLYLILLLFPIFSFNILINVSIKIISGIIFYFSFLLFFRNNLLIEILHKIKIY